MIHEVNELFLCTSELLWQTIVLTGTWGAFFLYWWARPQRKFVMIFASLLSMLATLLGMWYYLVQSHRWMSVVQPTVLYAGPGENYHAITQCSARELLCITNHAEQWLCVTSKTGKGWLPLK